MAYFPDQLVQRLFVYSPGRKSKRGAAKEPQYFYCILHQRVMAWGKLELRYMGSYSWDNSNTGDRNLLFMGLIILFSVDIVHERGISIRQWVQKQEMWFRYILYIGIICACLYLGVQTGTDAARGFIYFRF